MKIIRNLKSFASILMAAALVLSAGCAQDNSPKAIEAEIWTMPSTVKVLRDEDYRKITARIIRIRPYSLSKRRKTNTKTHSCSLRRKQMYTVTPFR